MAPETVRKRTDPPLAVEPMFRMSTWYCPAASWVRPLKKWNVKAGSTSVIVTVAVEGKPIKMVGDGLIKLTVNVLLVA